MKQVNIKEYFNQEMDKLRRSVVNPPSLLIIDATDGDAGNQIYIKKKVEDFQSLGWPIRVVKPDFDEELDHILCTNTDDCNIVQMPIAERFHFNPMQLNVSKDCDGLHPLTKVMPATVRGIIDYLDVCGFEYSSKNATVIGRSDIVGKPMAKALLDRDMTVTQCHSKTNPDDLYIYTRHSDLIIVAAGVSHLLSRASCPHAIVIDVGINRVNGRLTGDFKEVEKWKKDQAWSTPVPGGVGLLTRLGLIKNCLDLNIKRI